MNHIQAVLRTTARVIPVGATTKRSNLRAFSVRNDVTWHRCGTDSTSSAGLSGAARALVTTFPSSAWMRAAAWSCSGATMLVNFPGVHIH